MRFPRSALLAYLLLAACSPPRDPAGADGMPRCDGLALTEPGSVQGLVVIVNDTMRRDRAGAYGGPALTPNFDAFAAESLLFHRAVSPAPWTKPAVASLFTSLYPSQHRMLRHPETHPAAEGELLVDVLPAELDTLAERLFRAGWRTAGFVANPWLTRSAGFAQGFEVYEDSFARWDAPGEMVVSAAADWLARVPDDRPFFAYLHTVDSHLPYGHLRPNEVRTIRADRRPLVPEAAFTVSLLRVGMHGPIAGLPIQVEPSVALVERAYDRGIEQFDQVLGDLLAVLGDHPAADRIAVVVTSDHGEALFERGYGNHGRGLYDDELAIPLAARLPGVRPAQGDVHCPVGLTDLLPTLCDLLAIDCAGDLAGRSLFTAGKEGARYLVSEGVTRFPAHRAIRNERYKLIFAPAGPAYPTRMGPVPAPPERAYALYDLQEDPGEQRDLLEGWPLGRGVEPIASRMREVLHRAVAPGEAPEPGTTAVDPALLERLRALGYLNE